jgi:hypothetical protein
MSDTTEWLAERLAGAPVQLRTRMEQAIAAVPADVSIQDRLAQAAVLCLARGMRDDSRASALELLTADALLTHACEAAAEAGSDALNALATRWDANRFDNLVPRPA